MQAVLFYLAYPFVYLVASLPFGAMYRLSDFFYYVIRLTGYRRKVVLKNLRNSFPEKSEKEILSICESYYRYLCDLTLETFKTLKMSPEQAQYRCAFENPDWLKQLYEQKKSIIIVMGHYGNWEWAGPSFTLHTPYQLNVIYRPLSNPYFEKMLTGMRTKHGTKITPVKNTLRDMVANRNSITATAFVADQTATKRDAYWTTFLNQDTAVFTGPEKLAKKFGYTVVYMNVKRPKRGYYRVIPELMFDDPCSTADNEIMEAFTRRLEREILIDPTIWLWSHRRWKHKRKVNGTSVAEGPERI
ncbi:MAG TPA: lysophospholipid acyltransferase family protein [Ohtaekwangia sp.]|nr:lysophospholipid acyltransferase family protein [Ohtaekwangia sp.]